MLRTAMLGLLIGSFIFFCLACSVPLYQVAPIPKNLPPETTQTASREGLEVSAAAVTEDDQSFARFDTNLPLAGIVVVDIKLANHSHQATRSLKFVLQDATGRKFSALEPKAALKRIMEFEGVRVYPIEGKEQTLAQLQAIALPKKMTLAAQAEKHGVLFFHVRQDAAKIKALTLRVEAGKQTITLSLR